MSINRRHFLRKSLLATGGLFGVAQFAPNLLVSGAVAGGATIVDLSGDKAINLTNGSFVRGFDMGTWSRMRLGLRMAIIATDSMSGTPRFVMGLQAGSATQFFDASVTNFIGVWTRGDGFVFNSGIPDIYSSTGATNSDGRVLSKIGSTISEAGSNFANTFRFARLTTHWSAMILDITKGSPSWTFKLCYLTASPSGPVTRADLLAQMVAATPTLSAHAYSSAITHPFNETAGTVDHIAVGWDRFDAPCYITDIMVAKLAV